MGVNPDRQIWRKNYVMFTEMKIGGNTTIISLSSKLLGLIVNISHAL